jgi:uncharacterized membrane protein (GlpM family)
MSPDLFFWYGLVLKVAMTATIVVVVSVAAERSGPFIAALIAALPTAASATYIILAVEHPPPFVAAAAIGSMAANVAVAIFALTYAALAQRQGIMLSIAVAALVWFGVVAILRLVEWTPATALVLNAVVFAFTIPLSVRYRDAAVPRDAIRRSRYEPPPAGCGCCAGRRRGHDREPLDRLVCLRRVRGIPHRAGNFCGDRASARGREGGGCRARPCAACARWPASRISWSALSRRVDRRVVVVRGWPCDHHGVERRALGRAAVTAAHRLTGRAALLLDGELLLVDHLGPFAPLGLDVIGELLG